MARVPKSGSLPKIDNLHLRFPPPGGFMISGWNLDLVAETVCDQKICSHRIDFPLLLFICGWVDYSRPAFLYKWSSAATTNRILRASISIENSVFLRYPRIITILSFWLTFRIIIHLWILTNWLGTYFYRTLTDSQTESRSNPIKILKLAVNIV